MLRPGENVDVYLYAYPVDMRKSINGLSIIVEQSMVLPTNRARCSCSAIVVVATRSRFFAGSAMVLLSGTSDLSGSGSAGQRYKTP
jgi:transposase